MAAWLTGNDSICEILGLDPSVTGEITLQFAPDSFPTATVSMALTAEQVEGVRAQLKNAGFAVVSVKGTKQSKPTRGPRVVS